MLYSGPWYCLKSSFSLRARQKKTFYPFLARIKKKKEYDLSFIAQNECISLQIRTKKTRKGLSKLNEQNCLPLTAYDNA